MNSYYIGTVIFKSDDKASIEAFTEKMAESGLDLQQVQLEKPESEELATLEEIFGKA
jgi:hypothetical protein